MSKLKGNQKIIKMGKNIQFSHKEKILKYFIASQQKIALIHSILLSWVTLMMFS